MVSPLQLHYLQLFHLDGFSYNDCARLIKSAGSLSALLDDQYEASPDEAVDPERLAELREQLGKPRSKSRRIVDQTRTWLKQNESRQLLCFEDPAYPELLREIACPPPLLFVEGDPGFLKLPQLAMVGSRKASRNGEQAAFRLAGGLAGTGLGVTSGMAIGIDSQAHRGALAVGGWTVGVLGSGLDRVYPTRNRPMAREVTTRGALVSEFPLGTPPLPANFPRRNRIIAGLSLGVVVVEAALCSGSLITARQALESGREVFAVPGSILAPGSKGCHRLIRDGARLVDSVESILEDIPLSLLESLELSVKNPAPGKPEGQDIPWPSTQITATEGRPVLDANERKLLKLLEFDPCPADLLASRSGLPIEAVNRLLTGLELKGLLDQRAGRYQRLASGLQHGSD